MEQSEYEYLETLLQERRLHAELAVKKAEGRYPREFDVEMAHIERVDSLLAIEAFRLFMEGLPVPPIPGRPPLDRSPGKGRRQLQPGEKTT